MKALDTKLNAEKTTNKLQLKVAAANPWQSISSQNTASDWWCPWVLDLIVRKTILMFKILLVCLITFQSLIIGAV